MVIVVNHNQARLWHSGVLLKQVHVLWNVPNGLFCKRERLKPLDSFRKKRRKKKFTDLQITSLEILFHEMLYFLRKH